METGVGFCATHDAIGPDVLARIVEERGHESSFFAEHTHIPASLESPYPGDGDLPCTYAHTDDLFVAPTAAAVVTTRLRVGSGVCLVIEPDPIITAKEAASVDRLSGGRFEEHVAFDRLWSWPKPAQRPHPPILVGGNGPAVLDRVLAFGDAWFPSYARGGVPERCAELRARADRRIDLMVMGVPADPHVLEQFEQAGFRRAVHRLPSAGRGPVERALVRFESAVADLHGQ